MACGLLSERERAHFIPRRAGVVAVGLVALVALPGGMPAQQPAPAPSADVAKSAAKEIDPAKLPPNAILIISQNPRDALQHPDAIILTPEEYKKLLDAADQARKLSAPGKPEPPSVCRLSGRVETRGAHDVAVLRAEFQFR